MQALVLKKTIRQAGLISDSCLIFHLHLCYFLMSFSFFAATLYHTSLVPFILSSGKSGGPFSLLKNLYLWRTKRGGKGKQWGQTISFLPGATHLLFRVLSVRGDLHRGKWGPDRLFGHTHTYTHMHACTNVHTHTHTPQIWLMYINLCKRSLTNKAARFSFVSKLLKKKKKKEPY